MRQYIATVEVKCYIGDAGGWEPDILLEDALDHADTSDVTIIRTSVTNIVDEGEVE